MCAIAWSCTVPTFALSTGSLYTYGIARVFQLAAEAGFDAIEVLVDHRWDSRHPTYLKRLCGEYSLPVAAIHSPFVPHVPGWPHDPLGRLHESAALARQMGTKIVVAHLPFRIQAARIELFGSRRAPFLLPIFLPNERDYRRFVLDGLARFEAEEGIWAAVENMPAKRILGRRLEIHSLNNAEALSRLPHLTLDTTHLGTWGLDILSVYEQLKNRIVHVHLSNFNGQEHRTPEDGQLPLRTLVQRLTRDRYQGAISIEANPESLQAEDDAQVLAHLRQAVRYCRESLNS
jgi:sugar phosphate isomerase/epimerase